MTASAIERDRREETGSWPWSSLHVDFATYEAFQARGDTSREPPRIVRWFACFAGGDCEPVSS